LNYGFLFKFLPIRGSNTKKHCFNKLNNANYLFIVCCIVKNKKPLAASTSN
jgi:hypothetical protein